MAGIRPVEAGKFPAWLLLAGSAAILSVVLVTGMLSPPNNWDSMTYHMARVAHWMQNGHLLHYPSHIIRQHYQPPFAELIILHLQILSGTDAFANLVQWAAWAGTLISVSLVTKALGGTAVAQVTAVCFTATLPMAVLQGSSTQNDLVVGFFVITFVYFLLSIQAGFSYGNFFFGGLALGLALLSKGTTYVFVFPWLVWFAYDALVRRRVSVPFVKASLLLGGVALLPTWFFMRPGKSSLGIVRR